MVRAKVAADRVWDAAQVLRRRNAWALWLRVERCWTIGEDAAQVRADVAVSSRDDALFSIAIPAYPVPRAAALEQRLGSTYRYVSRGTVLCHAIRRADGAGQILAEMTRIEEVIAAPRSRILPIRGRAGSRIGWDVLTAALAAGTWSPRWLTFRAPSRNGNCSATIDLVSAPGAALEMRCSFFANRGDARGAWAAYYAFMVAIERALLRAGFAEAGPNDRTVSLHRTFSRMTPTFTLAHAIFFERLLERAACVVPEPEPPIPLFPSSM